MIRNNFTAVAFLVLSGLSEGLARTPRPSPTPRPTPAILTSPVASNLTLGQLLSESTLTGGTASTPGTFAWTTPTAVPPLGTATYAVTFTPTDLVNFSPASLSVVVTVLPPDFLFSPDWSAGLPLTPELLLKFAIGGASGPNEPSEPLVQAVEAGDLVLTIMVRTNSSKLTVSGETTTDLQGGWSASGVASTTEGVDQSGVPVGCERRRFRIPLGDIPGFVRFRAIYQP
jgi:hypothetical protein